MQRPSLERVNASAAGLYVVAVFIVLKTSLYNSKDGTNVGRRRHKREARYKWQTFAFMAINIHKEYQGITIQRKSAAAAAAAAALILNSVSISFQSAQYVAAFVCVCVCLRALEGAAAQR